MSNIMPYDDIFGGQKISLWTSIDISSVEGKMHVQKALGTADYTADDLKLVPFPVQNVVVHSVKIESEDGGVINANRTVLISPDGKTASFTSQGIISSLRNIFSLFGFPPYDEPLNMIVKETKTRKGWRTLNLVVV